MKLVTIFMYEMGKKPCLNVGLDYLKKGTGYACAGHISVALWPIETLGILMASSPAVTFGLTLATGSMEGVCENGLDCTTLKSMWT